MYTEAERIRQLIIMHVSELGGASKSSQANASLFMIFTYRHIYRKYFHLYLVKRNQKSDPM